MFISYAQNFEDVLLNRVFQDKKSGFYIDIGAHHPLYDSVTKSFYDSGWHGINIEPVNSFFELLQKERNSDINLNCAISDIEGELDFFELIGSGFSTFNKLMAEKLATQHNLDLVQYKVSTLTLADICHKYVDGVIDFLKIDVEGWEEKVIFSNDWLKFRPIIIIIEATIPNSPIRCQTKIPEFLQSHHYQKVYFDGLNDFYLAKEKIELHQYFQTPINMFDNFIQSKYSNPQEIYQKISEAQKNNFDTIHLKLKKANYEIHKLQKQSLTKDKLLTIVKNEKEDYKFEIKRLRKFLNIIQKKDNNKKDIMEKELLELKNKFNLLKRQLWQTEEWVKAMESSKFWKLRTQWFKIKRFFGITKD